MGKKIRSEMEAAARHLRRRRDGATASPPAKAGEIFDLMEKFADYGFNKSHAAAYALVSYQTAWLKANHPVAFLAASMTLDLDKTDKLAGHMQEASRLGIPVLPPDVNRSRRGLHWWRRSADGKPAIRFALAAVKRVGAGRDAGRWCAARDAKRALRLASPISPAGWTRSCSTRCRSRTWPRPAPSTRWSRTAPGWSPGAEVDPARAPRPAAEDARQRARSRLFGGAEPAPRAAAPAATCRTGRSWRSWPSRRRRSASTSRRIRWTPTRRVLQRLGRDALRAIAERAQGRRGAAEAGRHRGRGEGTARPRPAAGWPGSASPTPSGSYEVTCFSEVLARARDLLAEGTAVLVTAEARLDGETLRLTAQDVEALEKAAQRVGAGDPALARSDRRGGPDPHAAGARGPRQGPRRAGRPSPGRGRRWSSRCPAASTSRRG